jgi:hypothetical protein
MAQQKKRGGYSPVNLTGPGTIFTLAFIALAIGMGLLLTRGVTPTSTLTTPEQTGDLEIIPETPDPSQKGLQLKTLRFKECGSKAAVGLLVDRSGSMGPKMNDLRSALTTFTQGLGNQSVVGMYSFSSNNYGATQISEDVPFSRYQNVKQKVSSTIQNLRPAGSTNTRSAFLFIKDKIIAATKQFPDNIFALIFLSDGIPERDPIDPDSGRCYSDYRGQRCFALSEDPTVDPDVSKAIRDAKIRIYSIAIYNKNDLSDIFFLPDMRNMMTKISSSDSYYETPDSSQLKKIYSDIATKICNDVK